jgi:hypothetical protein
MHEKKRKDAREANKRCMRSREETHEKRIRSKKRRMRNASEANKRCMDSKK